jgi:hypothetical protein
MVLQFGVGIIVLAIGFSMLVTGYSEARGLAQEFRGYIRLQNLLTSYNIWALGRAGFALLLGIAQLLILFASIEVRRWMAATLPTISLTVITGALVSFFVFNRYKRDAIRQDDLRPNDD